MKRDIFLICALQAQPRGQYFVRWSEGSNPEVCHTEWDTAAERAYHFSSYQEARVEAELITVHYARWLAEHNMLPLQVLAVVKELHFGLERPN